MLKNYRLTLTCVVFVLLSVPLFSQDESVITVDPVGEPRGLSKGNAVRCFLWYDVKGWHLRTDSNGKAHVFNGSVGIVGGKVTAITGFGNLEAGAKKKKADLGIVNESKDQITFKFNTSIKRDGFDFQVDDSAEEIRFTLLIDWQAGTAAGPNRASEPTIAYRSAVVASPSEVASPTEVAKGMNQIDSDDGPVTQHRRIERMPEFETAMEQFGSGPGGIAGRAE